MRNEVEDIRIEDVRVESSIPVQSRISILELATLVKMWESNGVRIETMSQLLAISIGLLCGELRRAGKVESITSVKEAHHFLVEKGIYQKSMRRKADKKISMALGFESLRAEGVDPREYAPQYYKGLHNKHSVRGDVPITGIDNIQSRASQVRLEDVEYAKRRIEEQRKMHEERRAEIQKQVDDAYKRIGAEVPMLREGMSKEELAERDRLREQEVQARENTPVDEQLEFLKANGIVEGNQID